MREIKLEFGYLETNPFFFSMNRQKYEIAAPATQNIASILSEMFNIGRKHSETIFDPVTISAVIVAAFIFPLQTSTTNPKINKRIKQRAKFVICESRKSDSSQMLGSIPFSQRHSTSNPLATIIQRWIIRYFSLFHILPQLSLLIWVYLTNSNLSRQLYNTK